MDDVRLPGRKAEAARNDGRILAAARSVFLRDPTASMAAVAREADVGMSALYRRYPGKDALLQQVCGDGLRTFQALAESALTVDDPWESFAGFLRDVVDSDVHALTVRLAGTFESTDELRRTAERASTLVGRLVSRAVEAGVVRTDLVANDVPMILEQVTAVQVPDPGRTHDLRERYLAMHLDALRAPGPALPHPAPTARELGSRWAGSHGTQTK
jgi:AcrR family transcriptional regulator